MENSVFINILSPSSQWAENSTYWSIPPYRTSEKSERQAFDGFVNWIHNLEDYLARELCIKLRHNTNAQITDSFNSPVFRWFALNTEANTSFKCNIDIFQELERFVPDPWINPYADLKKSYSEFLHKEYNSSKFRKENVFCPYRYFAQWLKIHKVNIDSTGLCFSKDRWYSSVELDLIFYYGSCKFIPKEGLQIDIKENRLVNTNYTQFEFFDAAQEFKYQVRFS